VVEAAAVGQLEFCCGAISLFLPSSYIDPPPTRWECGNPAPLFFAGFPSPVGSLGNSFLLLEFSTLSTGRHFYRAKAQFFSERRDAGSVSFPARFLRIDSPCISIP
jgi:hypothetical protein